MARKHDDDMEQVVRRTLRGVGKTLSSKRRGPAMDALLQIGVGLGVGLMGRWALTKYQRARKWEKEYLNNDNNDNDD